MKKTLIIIVAAVAAAILTASVSASDSAQWQGNVSFESVSAPSLNCSMPLRTATGVYLLAPGNMLPDKETLLVCPHCETNKAVLSLASGNTIGGRQWWDLKTDYPMLPHVSFVQKCLACNKYYMRNLAEHKKGNGYSFELGHVSYEEMREAWAQMKDSLEGPERGNLLIEYVWAYNDAFQREGVEREDACPDDEQMEEFRAVVRELVGTLPPENRIVRAEFLREARFFEEALDIVEHEEEPSVPVFLKLSAIIRKKCLNRDSSVGII